MDYTAVFTALLPDLFVVVALFAALGVDYGCLRGASLADRADAAARIGGVGLVGALVALGFQLTGSLSVDAFLERLQQEIAERRLPDDAGLGEGSDS